MQLSFSADESGGTVRFLCGRTETVRSLSMELKKFCEMMSDTADEDSGMATLSQSR